MPAGRYRRLSAAHKFNEDTRKDPAIISEFYHLRRTAIKDIAGYLGFLAGFIGSAPFAWGLLAEQLDAGRFARGLWYFFGIVTTAGIFTGIAGLAVGFGAGLLWEQIHRYRRDLPRPRSSTPELKIDETRDQPRPQLKLVPEDPGAGRFWGAASLRDLILAVILLGIVGLIAELLLLEHTESWQQWIPLIALGGGFVATILVRLRPGSGTFRAFRVTMVIFLATGLLGLYFHYAGNVEFALERTPELSGLALAWKALRGATPALAPGALAQLGLLGLVYAFRHPSTTGSPEPERRIMK